MHTKHVMIDIETLSTETDAAIIAVGAVEFDLEQILQERLWLLDPRLTPGRRDHSTLRWWQEQNAETAQRMWAGNVTPWDFAQDFTEWTFPFRDDHWVWAGPSTFDLSILETFFRQHIGLDYPLNWRNHRDLTTISRVAEQLGIDYSGEAFPGFIPHDALSDAIKQARRTQIILRQLGYRNDVWASYDLANKERPGL
jgi:hypothetical protein